MAAKQLIFEEAARQALLRGVQQLNRAVAATLGPKGRNVVIEQRWANGRVELPVLPEEKKECSPLKTTVACPQCASFNVTTA